jgi:hypothetical protein
MSAVAQTIAKQLGNRALVMLGAYDFVAGDDFFQFAFKGCKTANVLIIRLESNDTYTLEFHKRGRRATDWKLVNRVESIHADQLHETIESHTGLYTNL